MKDFPVKLLACIADTEGGASAIDTETWYFKPSPLKWSKAEVFGHLIDSALNNIQRFVRAQYESQAPQIFYAQNDWVRLQDYQHMPQNEAIALWALLNRQIARLVAQMPVENKTLPCYFYVENVLQTVPLQYVIDDYWAHLQHHLSRAFDIIGQY